MPANASRQVTSHSGGDHSDTNSEHRSEQRQSGEQHNTVTQDQDRTNNELRNTRGERDEEVTNQRDNSNSTHTEREQTVTGETSQVQEVSEASSTEHPLVLKRNTETGGGTTQTTNEDFAVQVEWEVEIVGS